MSEGRFRRAYLGIAGGTRPLPPRLARELERRVGVEVVDVVADSPAAAAGLRPEDLIVAIDDTAVERIDDVQRLLVGDRIGETVQLDVLREGRRIALRLVPVELDL
jgi:serine protease Do